MDVTQRLGYPSVLRRYVASLIDGSVLALIFGVYVHHPLFSPRTGSIEFWPMLALALYEPLLTRYLCTLGQLLMGIRIRTEPEIEPVPVWRVLLRLSLKYSLGIVSFFFLPAHPRKQALHDLAADTIVLNARDVAAWHTMAATREPVMSDPLGPKPRFSGGLTAALLIPAPAILGALLIAILEGVPKNLLLTLGLGLSVLAFWLLACVATAVATVRIVRGRVQRSARNYAQIFPAALVAVTYFFILGYALWNYLAHVPAR